MKDFKGEVGDFPVGDFPVGDFPLGRTSKV